MAEPPTTAEPRAALTGRRAAGDVWAAIDLGTNSFHLLVAKVDAHGQLDVLEQDKEMVRLGSGAGPLRQLTPEAIDRGLATLGRFRRIADSFGASIAAVGTSALREAVNRREFVVRAREEVGVDVDIVSGVEEARLIHLGVMSSLPLLADRILLVDIGGGSTELVVGEGNDVLLARSVKLGAIRLTDRFFPDGRTRSKAVAACREYVRSFLVPATTDARAYAPFTAVGSSGTILTLARICAAREGRETVATGESFTADALGHAVADIIARKTAAARGDVAGLEERRRDIIPAGALLLEEIVELMSIDEIVVSEAALREGILLDRAATAVTAGRPHRLSDIRQRSVMRMAETFHEDLEHVDRAAELAVQLFDGLEPLHRLEPTDRELLVAAALLHNVGLFISHAAHHRHSYYVIRNSDQLVGFTDGEVELVALVARYHRKSQPKTHHVEYQALAKRDRRRVRLLAGMLRVAIALDRTRRGVVRSVEVRSIPGAGAPATVEVDVHLDPDLAPDVDVSLERYTAEQRLGLLANALEASVVLTFVPA